MSQPPGEDGTTVLHRDDDHLRRVLRCLFHIACAVIAAWETTTLRLPSPDLSASNNETNVCRSRIQQYRIVHSSKHGERTAVGTRRLALLPAAAAPAHRRPANCDRPLRLFIAVWFSLPLPLNGAAVNRPAASNAAGPQTEGCRTSRNARASAEAPVVDTLMSPGASISEVAAVKPLRSGRCVKYRRCRRWPPFTSRQ